VADTELPVIVESPGIDLLGFVDIEGVMIASPNVLSVSNCHSLDHECLLVLVAGV
jgi:hypothetical protein